MRPSFNSTAASLFFSSNLGAPYSHRATFFSVVDTLEDNYFAPISSELLPFMIRYLQQLYPSSFDLIFKEALNKRLGLHNDTSMHQTFEDLLVQAVVLNHTTIEELLTLPELDSWTYTSNSLDGPIGFSPSSFVAGLYRAAGLFEEGIEINTMEFTVRDVYELNFFENRAKNIRPKGCMEADPHIEYC